MFFFLLAELGFCSPCVQTARLLGEKKEKLFPGELRLLRDDVE